MQKHGLNDHNSSDLVASIIDENTGWWDINKIRTLFNPRTVAEILEVVIGNLRDLGNFLSRVVTILSVLQRGIPVLNLPLWAGTASFGSCFGRWKSQIKFGYLHGELVRCCCRQRKI